MTDGYTAIRNNAFGWLKLLTAADFRVYLLIVRKTAGFQKEKDAIPISQFMHFSGLGDRQIRNSIQKLERISFIRVFRAKRRVSVYVLLDPPVYSANLVDAKGLRAESDDFWTEDREEI